MMASTKKMTLSEARAELEGRGFSCVDETPNLLVGVRSECRWGMMAKMDVMVFVNRVEGLLTVDRIESDLRRLPDLVQNHYVGGCPPFGANRAIMVLQIYLTDQQIESVALGKILSEPSNNWCSLNFLAAQDGEGKSHFYESSTPCWGRAHYPELRYWAGLLTGRDVPALPPTKKTAIVLNAFAQLYFLWMLSLQDDWHLFLIYFLGLMAIFFGVAAACDWCRRCRYRNCRGTDDSGTGFVQYSEPHEVGKRMV